MAAPLTARQRARAVVSRERHYRVAPGLRFRTWDQTTARGTIRAYLLRANPAKPGLTIGYAGMRHVAQRAVLTRMLARDDAIAGVNADFFDITDTGAARGVGVDGGTVLHGPTGGDWTKTFTVTGKADARIGVVPVVANVVGRPGVHLTSVNSPTIPVGGIGLFTRKWGAAPGYRVTDGAAHRDVRQVVVRHGRVVSNSRAVSRGTRIRGKLLLGRGRGAVALNRELPVGTKVDITVEVARHPRVAVGGSAILVKDGDIVTTDDGELHPRTAVGIDDDTGKILLLVVDGRQESSSGCTLYDLASLMVSLGAEQVLNLDGGGSSTMVTRRPSGAVKVANNPSDGQPREVGDGLELVYRP
jgi:exopolysaccharide biosynthesis protein